VPLELAVAGSKVHYAEASAIILEGPMSGGQRRMKIKDLLHCRGGSLAGPWLLLADEGGLFL
jgi:hypothetical protein